MGPAAPRGSGAGWGWGVGGLRCAAGHPGAETGRRSWRPSRRCQGGACPHHRGSGQAPASSPGSPPSWGCQPVGNPAGAGSAQPPQSPPSGNALSSCLEPLWEEVALQPVEESSRRKNYGSGYITVRAPFPPLESTSPWTSRAKVHGEASQFHPFGKAEPRQ